MKRSIFRKLNKAVTRKSRCLIRILPVMILCTVLMTCVSDVYSAEKYVINGTELPLQEKGYIPGDYMGAGQCWLVAQHIYYSIWGRFFYQNPGSDDDMLRDYPLGEARRVTAANARLFISEAPVGAVIRIQEDPEGPDELKTNRHSLILLDKTEEGCTVYHCWASYSSVSTYTWKEFEKEFRYTVDFGNFKYIKYPGAKALKNDNAIYKMEKELVISSDMHRAVEITEKKRN